MVLPEELYDVFYVTQLTRGTALKDIGVDWVRMEPWKRSRKHRHNKAETVLFIKQGSGCVVVDDNMRHLVQAEDRVCIPIGAWHIAFSWQDGLQFISIQYPCIHDEATGRHDLEPFPEEEYQES